MTVLLSEMKVVTPRSLPEALALLAQHREQARPLAGGTDAMVRVKEGHWRVPLWIDVRRLPELNQVAEEDGHLVVGAALPYLRMQRSEVLKAKAPLLLQAVADIGAVQIQAAGTIGGNLGTASPAGDAIPPLYALSAQVQLASQRGERWVAIGEYCQGPGRTARQPDELILSVRFPAQPAEELSLWQKLGLRGAQAISVISLAMRIALGPRGVTLARLAYGSVGPTVLRAYGCEEALIAAGPLDRAKIAAVARLACDEVRPISDVRASAQYRREMAAALLERGLLRLLPGEQGRDA